MRWQHLKRQFVADLKILLERLLDAEIEFVIVGGFAAVLHGSTLVTRDLDVCTLLTDINVEKLRGVLVDLAPVHRMAGGRLDFLTNPDPGVPVKNLYLETNAGAVDVDLFGRRCLVMSMPDLIAAKRAMGRDRDLLAIRELEAIAEKLK